MTPNDNNIPILEERLYSIFSNVNDWLRYGEKKNTTLLAFCAASLLAVARLHMVSNIESCWWEIYVLEFYGGVGLAGLVALISTVPKVNLRKLISMGDPTETDNLLFFQHIQKYDENQYLKALIASLELEDYQPNRLENNLAGQIITNSRIATAKFEAFKFALWAVLFGVGGPLVVVVAWAFREEKGGVS